LCRHAGGKAAVYHVPHYTSEACGAAFGPLSLACLLHFCRGLDAALALGAVALTTPKGDTATRLNSLVMLGGYMIAKHAWSAKQLADTIGEDSRARFVCSWSRSASPEPQRLLTVFDTWAGLEIASKRSWLDRVCMEDDAELEAAVSEYNMQAICFDATWIIPGLLMVSSDPTINAVDPNPATCKRISPSNGCDSIASGASTRCTASDIVRTPSTASQDSACSVHTVCREFAEIGDDLSPCDPSSVPADFASFLVQSGVGIVVRANHEEEAGMPGPSYDEGTFEPFGIEQANVRVVDRHGALPRPEDVARMIEVCETFLDPAAGEHAAVLVHCKGGFGRSVVLAACLAIHRYDLPGSALLGWVRVARPGAITTREQELFLKSLKGKADVMRYSKFSRVSGTSCAGCSLQ